MATPATMTLADILEAQNGIVRQGEYNERSGQGGYRVIGRMIQLVHEVARDANHPDEEVTKKIGVTMDWRHFHNGPLLGVTKDRSQILFLSKVPPLPDLIDPNWKRTQYVEMPYGRVPADALSEEQLKAAGIKLENPPKIKQRFVEHMSGTWGDFMVCRPLTQILFKMDGIIGMTTIDFANDVYTGESAAFFLNPVTGEGHIYGGQFVIAALKG
jgi:hypothetical protein